MVLMRLIPWVALKGDRIGAVNPQRAQCLAAVLLVYGISTAQKNSAPVPDRLVIARDTFWDFGPPFNYYDLIQIAKTTDGLSLDQVLVTPHGQACLQPATVEERTAVLHKTMSELLEGRNPCAIPEKDLHREIKRCKKCLGFSGVHVFMQASCNGQDRHLAMDILDRDIYDSRTPTPENTSWSMRVLSELSDSLGPGSEAKPIFQLSPATRQPIPNTPLVGAIRNGRYDDLFGKNVAVSKIAYEAEQPPPPPPSVTIESVAPVHPTDSQAPKYPPIAFAARVEGLVEATFNVTGDGKVQDVTFLNEARLKMLQPAVSEAISKWTFPPEAWGKNGKVSVRFALNCHADAQ